MSAPRVSVLIGCWNNAATLGEAVESIRSQTLTDLELIVVDDGSTDDTPSIVHDLQSGDSRISYLPLEHMGISQSLNEGLRRARADLVAFQDADDVSMPDRLARQAEVLERRAEVLVVGCRMQEVNEAGLSLRPRTRFVVGDVNRVLMKFNPIPNSCAMVRRSAVLAAGGFDPRYRYAMDYDLWLRLAERGVVATLDDQLAVRRMGAGNVAARAERKQTAEAIRIQLSAMRRRSAVLDVTALALPLLSLATPLGLKRQLRRIRGQAP